ncbi:T-cell immunoreceptor with Ig and ITIM domains isoform X2 [Ambystoma mexicanum]|uniref:T-cell immunoreceptor with Ig and ITIM domains isoform X2 n=1 Tax=Ambystoma mexicanum TaxID=8296 RepID=UPI0037E972A5
MVTAGVLTGSVVTPGNISAVRGSIVTLRCELVATNALVVQVIWNQCDKVAIAVFTDKEATVKEAFRERFALAEEYGITIRSVEYNDTGHYCCIFYIFPDGRYDGRFFLEVRGNVQTSIHLPLVIGLLPLGVLLLMVLVVAAVLFKPKRRPLARAATSRASNHYSPSMDSAGNPPNTTIESAVNPPTTVLEEDTYEENPDYFIVMQYGGGSTASLQWRAVET